jgi:hypothetical protein
MAWDLVSVGAVTTVTSGNLSPALPAGTVDGDLILAPIAYRSNAAFTLPAGWQLVRDSNTGDVLSANNGTASAVLAYIVRGASAPANTFTRTVGLSG